MYSLPYSTQDKVMFDEITDNISEQDKDNLQKLKRYSQEIISLIPRCILAGYIYDIVEASEHLSFFNERAKKSVERMKDNQNYDQELMFKLYVPITEALLTAYKETANSVTSSSNSYINFKNKVILNELINPYIDKINAYAESSDDTIVQNLQAQIKELYGDVNSAYVRLLVSSITRVLVSTSDAKQKDTHNLVLVECVL